eukprot:TRINITY_DN311676_c0_g1_i2.p1 TRINITY_DN311676_c0_g1~~TRINITY_DN311676_c0_g1_i2.p1  ORF type:complete len:221 (-),score=88.15 TRINITY_DN311676_c0_g1_i2:52-714(-)
MFNFLFFYLFITQGGAIENGPQWIKRKSDVTAFSQYCQMEDSFGAGNGWDLISVVNESSFKFGQKTCLNTDETCYSNICKNPSDASCADGSILEDDGQLLIVSLENNDTWVVLSGFSIELSDFMNTYGSGVTPIPEALSDDLTADNIVVSAVGDNVVLSDQITSDGSQTIFKVGNGGFEVASATDGVEISLSSAGLQLGKNGVISKHYAVFYRSLTFGDG